MPSLRIVGAPLLQERTTAPGVPVPAIAGLGRDADRRRLDAAVLAARGAVAEARDRSRSANSERASRSRRSRCPRCRHDDRRSRRPRSGRRTAGAPHRVPEASGRRCRSGAPVAASAPGPSTTRTAGPASGAAKERSTPKKFGDHAHVVGAADEHRRLRRRRAAEHVAAREARHAADRCCRCARSSRPARRRSRPRRTLPTSGVKKLSLTQAAGRSARGRRSRPRSGWRPRACRARRRRRRAARSSPRVRHRRRRGRATRRRRCAARSGRRSAGLLDAGAVVAGDQVAVRGASAPPIITPARDARVADLDADVVARRVAGRRLADPVAGDRRVGRRASRRRRCRRGRCRRRCRRRCRARAGDQVAGAGAEARPRRPPTESSPITRAGRGVAASGSPAIAIPRPLPETVPLRSTPKRLPKMPAASPPRIDEAGAVAGEHVAVASQAGRTRRSRSAPRRRGRARRCPCPRRSCGRRARRGRCCGRSARRRGAVRMPVSKFEIASPRTVTPARLDVEAGAGAGRAQPDARRRLRHAGAAVDRPCPAGHRRQVGAGPGSSAPATEREVDRVRLALRRDGRVGLHDRRAQRALAAAGVAARDRLVEVRAVAERVDRRTWPRARQARAKASAADNGGEADRANAHHHSLAGASLPAEKRSAAPVVRGAVPSRARSVEPDRDRRRRARAPARAAPGARGRGAAGRSGARPPGTPSASRPSARAQHGGRAPVAGEPAVVGAEQDEVGGDRRGAEVLLGLRPGPRSAAPRRRRASARGRASARPPAPAARLQRARARAGRGRGSATGSSGGGWAPSARGRTARAACRAVDRLGREGLVRAPRADGLLELHQPACGRSGASCECGTSTTSGPCGGSGPPAASSSSSA